MITKKQRQSSRSYQEREALAAMHHARTPQIYKKEFPSIRRAKTDCMHKTIWQRFLGFLRSIFKRTRK